MIWITIKQAIKVLESREQEIKISIKRYKNIYIIHDKKGKTITEYTEQGFKKYFNEYCEYFKLGFMV